MIMQNGPTQDQNLGPTVGDGRCRRRDGTRGDVGQSGLHE
jgi:hypothetical protein